MSFDALFTAAVVWKFGCFVMKRKQRVFVISKKKDNCRIFLFWDSARCTQIYYQISRRFCVSWSSSYLVMLVKALVLIKLHSWWWEKLGCRCCFPQKLNSALIFYFPFYFQQFVNGSFESSYYPTAKKETHYPSVIHHDHKYNLKIVDIPDIPFFPVSSFYNISDLKGTYLWSI